MPPRSHNNSVKGKTAAEETLRSRLNDQSMVSDSSLFPQWTISATGQSYLIHPARSSSDISIARNEVWLISLQLKMFVRGDTAMKIALGLCLAFMHVISLILGIILEVRIKIYKHVLTHTKELYDCTVMLYHFLNELTCCECILPSRKNQMLL